MVSVESCVEALVGNFDPKLLSAEEDTAVAQLEGLLKVRVMGCMCKSMYGMYVRQLGTCLPP